MPDEVLPGQDIEADDDALAVQAHHQSGAFAILYRRHLNRVYHYLLARTQNVADAQDLTAQTFMSALENIRRYQPQGKFLAWLLTIARHKANDHFRHQRHLISLEDAEEMPHPALPPEEAVDRRLQLEHIAHALNQLSPERAEALNLRLFSGLSAAEISIMLGKSEAAVKMLIHRAWHDLRQRLAPVLLQEMEE